MPVWVSSSVQSCFSSCHTIASSADMDFVRLVSFQQRLPVIQHWAGEKLQAFFFFLPWWEREESPIFKSSQFISCSSLHLHVLQPCYNSFLLWLLLQSCSTAPGIFFFFIPTALHNLHHRELYGRRLTSVICRHNRQIISAADMASRCCYYGTYSAWVQSLWNWEGNLDMNGPLWEETKKH